jgi:transcriptional regulator with XRE-family HTH domain
MKGDRGFAYGESGVTPEQCRQARVLLNWNLTDLARASGCAYHTVRYVEAGRGQPRPGTLAAIRVAFEAVGVVFIDEVGEGPGVRLRNPAPLTPEQCLRARKLLGWTRVRLAGLAGCSDSAVRTFEAGQNISHGSTRQAIRAALEAVGIIFMEEDERGPGVQLRKPAS